MRKAFKLYKEKGRRKQLNSKGHEEKKRKKELQTLK